MEKKKMKQNKKYLAIIPTIAIIVSILAIPVIADVGDPVLVPYFQNPTVQDVKANGLYIGDVTGGTKIYVGASVEDCYIFAVTSGSAYISYPASNTSGYIYPVWETDTTLSPRPLGTYNSNYELYYDTYPRPNTNVQIPVYQSLDAGLSAVSEIIESGGSSSYSYDLDYSLPPGNVAFVELTSDSSDLILTTDMPSFSNLFGEAWSNVSQMYGYSNSLPSSGSSFNTSGLSTIDWSKAAPFNVLGQSKNAAKILSVSTSSTYLVIYNPLYFYVRDGGNGAESSFLDNGYIRIRLNDVSNVKVFSLTSSAQIGPNASTEDAISSTVTSSGVTQTIDPDTGLPIWTDSDGNTVEAPGIGNGNIASSGTTTFSILQQIADTISNFFQGSVGAISNLIDNGSSFMSKLGTLYSWLPAPVYTVLTSALILVITIGVIKVFL